jgi:hypothetical protein
MHSVKKLNSMISLFSKMSAPTGNSNMTAILAIAGAAVVGIAIAGGAYYLYKKSNDDDDGGGGKVTREGLLFAGVTDCTGKGAPVTRYWMQVDACKAVGGTVINEGSNKWCACAMSICPAADLPSTKGVGLSAIVPESDSCFTGLSNYGMVGAMRADACKTLGGIMNEVDPAADTIVRCHMNYGTCAGKGGVTRSIYGSGKCPAGKKSTQLIIDAYDGALDTGGCSNIGGQPVDAGANSGCAVDICT